MQHRLSIFLSAGLCLGVLYLWPWAIKQKTNRLAAEAAAKARKTVVKTSASKASVEPVAKLPSRLLFPVQGASLEDIISGFGDPRDGGKRRHEGVDIRADRGAPVLAVADGKIHRVKEGGNGGRQVWLELANGWMVYYAHLQTQLVSEGQKVAAGDLVGTVGDTGNARRAGPHLHFCLYPEKQKAVDPLPYLPGQLPLP